MNVDAVAVERLVLQLGRFWDSCDRACPCRLEAVFSR